MKTLMMKFAIALSLTGIIVACSSSGGGFAGIGGSGFISTGTVTGFGSVFVNGVEFDTRSTVFEVEDASGSQDDLRVGMVVQVKGSINADGVTGTATGIRYGDDLQGPIASITTNLDGNIKTLSILGTTVVVTSADTAFEGVTFATLQTGYVVEVSGLYDNTDVLQASYIEFKSASLEAGSILETTGDISGLSGTSFRIRNVNVNAAAANISDLPNGLQDGVRVEVKGPYDISTNTINASSVEGDEISLEDDGSEVSVEGYITRYVSISNFDINGYPVNASAAQFEPATLQLGVGIKVEAEGSVSNGVLVAESVEARGGDAEVSAVVSYVDQANSRFNVRLFTGAIVTVQLTSATLTEDDVGIDDHLALSELVTGNFVEVRGFESDISTITATRVKRREPDVMALQGYARAASGSSANGTITVLGVTYTFGAGTEFQDENDATLDATGIDALLSQIEAGLIPTLVNIVDEDGNGVAEEIELEN